MLDKQIDDVTKVSGTKFNFTPRDRRGTDQDLARVGGIHCAATRAISDHVIQASRQNYSTVPGGKVKDDLAKVAKIATAGANVIDIATARRERV